MTETQAPPDTRRWWALALLSVAQFMLMLDVTAVTIAPPHIGPDLGLSRGALTLVMSAYTLLFGGLMLVGGRAADFFGARKVVIAGLALFTAASLVAGLAVNGAMLVGGRIGRGLLLRPHGPAHHPVPSFVNLTQFEELRYCFPARLSGRRR